MITEPQKAISKSNPSAIDKCNLFDSRIKEILSEMDLELVMYNCQLYIFDNELSTIIGEVRF